MTACPSPQPKISLPALPYPPVTLNAFQTSTNIAKEISLISRGSYAVLKPIGKGSMGIVYLIQSTNEDSSKGNELFAMKEMDYGSDGYDEYDNSNQKQLNNKLKLIQREIRIFSHLSHPNIVHYYTSMISVANSSIQLVQEYCNRGTLYQAVKERKLAGERHYSEIEVGYIPFFIFGYFVITIRRITTPNIFIKISTFQVLVWSAQLASALTYLHESKILHRDLKSQNIFLTSNIAQSHTSPLNTAVKLGDFGISRPLEGTCDLASTCVGTPAYMAPEVCHKSLYSFPCDVWSLGCVLVEICSLKPAFQSAGIVCYILQIEFPGQYYSISDKSLLGLVSMVFKILSADYTRVPGIYSQALTSLIDSLFQAEPELRPTAKQVFNIVCDLLYEQNVAPNATSNSLEDYENDFDSLSDHSGTINLEISQEMATLSFIPCQDALDHTKQQTTISANDYDYDPYTSLNREISLLNTTKTLLPQTSDHYSDDFDSFSENEDD